MLNQPDRAPEQKSKEQSSLHLWTIKHGDYIRSNDEYSKKYEQDLRTKKIFKWCIIIAGSITALILLFIVMEYISGI